MLQVDDLKYVSTNLANLAGIPVRLYHSNEQIFYHSLISIIKDPFLIDKESAFKLKDDICYYQNQYYYYYGIINFEEYKIIVGPTRQLPISKQELKAISFALGIHTTATEDFVSQMETLASLPLMTLLQILCMIYFSITGEKKSLESIVIHESNQTIFKDEMEKEEADRKI